MVSDWLYFLTVPAYTPAIKYLLIFFILMPVTFLFVVYLTVDKDARKEIIALFFGLFPLYVIYFDNKEDKELIERESAS